MDYPTPAPTHGPAEVPRTSDQNEAHSSGVSWPAVIAGAAVAAALSVILLALGTGLGLSSVSPWSGTGASASAVGAAAIVWLILMQVLSSSMGGYLAGRLRTKWANIHNDEVYFRDTAHGFLVWAVGLVLTASLLGSAAVAMMGGSRAGSPAAARGNVAAEQSAVLDPNQYFIDKLLRTASAPPASRDTELRLEAGRVLANGLRLGALPAEDKTYLAHAVAAIAGVSVSEGDRRVGDAFEAEQQAADVARKALAHLSLWLFVALLIGAFCASLSATVGGRQRDHVKVV